MRRLPRTGEEIFDTGVIFTPDKMAMAWDLMVEELEASQSNGGSSGGFDLALWGCGRVAGADFFAGDAAQITLPDSSALALKLPDAIYYVADADGVMHRFDTGTRTVSGCAAAVGRTTRLLARRSH